VFRTSARRRAPSHTGQCRRSRESARARTLPEIGVTKRPTGISAKQGAAAPEVVAGSSETRTLTLRLAPAVHDRLREMAYTSRRSQHSLLLEALDDLFRKHGKPLIPS
jgi:hypothetical protein